LAAAWETREDMCGVGQRVLQRDSTGVVIRYSILCSKVVLVLVLWLR